MCLFTVAVVVVKYSVVGARVLLLHCRLSISLFSRAPQEILQRSPISSEARSVDYELDSKINNAGRVTYHSGSLHSNSG